MANFTLDMSKYGEKTIKQIDQFVRKTAIDLTTSIIKSTPVDTGRARANWFVSFESAIEDTTDDTNSAKALSNATNTIRKGNLGGTIFIQNNLDYIAGLEYGQPYGNRSKQANKGMVRINVERFAQR